MATYIGCLAQAKSDFARAEEYRNDMFFKKAMMLEKRAPSEGILRQRLNAIGKDDMEAFKDIIDKTNIELLTSQKTTITSRYKNYIPVDIDVSPHDNSGTKKEGVEYTYKGYFGYSPIYAYIGKEGYLLNLELRKGSEHSQCSKTIPFLTRTISLAKEIIKEDNLLFTLDSGYCCKDNIELFRNERVDYIIKKNNRKEDLGDIFRRTKKKYEEDKENENSIVKKIETREGKEYYITSIEETHYLKDDEGNYSPVDVRVVQECIQRTIDKYGQVLIIPEYEIKQYYTSLGDDISNEDVIELYHKHATCEQFNSEIKTDLDRLPSGKFNTNEVVLKLAELTFNMLRMIGQASISLQKDNLKVERRRIKTVIKDIINLASKIVLHARQEYIALSNLEIFKETFKNLFTYFYCT